MKHICSILTCIFISLCAFGQESQLWYPDGQLKCSYNRLLSPDTADASKVMVTFTFVNGHKPLAISYRQESMKNHLQWQYFQTGDTSTDKKVKVITANLMPDESLIWQYCVLKDSLSAKPIFVEPAALLLMKQDFDVEKIQFKESSPLRP